LFTDKSGIRPVYYYQKGNVFVYSSLLSFLENLPFVDLDPDFQGVCEHLAFSFCLSNRTPYQHIKRLNGGECLIINSGIVRVEYYWDWQKIQVKKIVTDKDIEEAYQCFDNAIKQRITQSEEAIAFLSGGLDSRVICAQVNKHVKKLHTFNFSTNRSQDNEFAKLFADNAKLIHHEKQFPSLAYPNWAQLIANEIKANSEQLHESTHQGTVWSGDGGSVAVGNVYIDNYINDALIKGDNDEAISHYLLSNKISIPIRFLKNKYAKQANGLIERSISEELLSNKVDPAKAMYYFLMNNDQKRHLQLHFESICQHKVELCLPFFDSAFLEKIYAIPSSELMYHKFYMKWFEYFPSNAQETPWQTYPQHEKCLLKAPDDLSYQWEVSAKNNSSKSNDFTTYLEAKNSPLFVKLFDANKVFIAMVLHRLGIKDFSYLIKNFKQIAELK